MRIFTVALLLSWVAPLLAADEWATRDRVLLGSAMTLLVIDWGQTLSITNEAQTTASIQGQQPVVVSSRREHQEHNLLLGDEPTRAEINRYFTLALIGTAGLAHVLPAQYRRYFLVGVVALEALVVLHNHHIGLRVDF